MMSSQLSDAEVDRLVKGIEAKQKLKHDQRVNTWMVTLNHPCEHVPECAGLEPEAACHALLRLFLTNRNGGRRKSRGAAICYERGLKKGTDHVHMLLSFTGRGGAAASTVVRLFPSATIEPMRGTVEEAMAYLRKDGKHASKTETTVVAPIVDGDPIAENPKSLRGKAGNDSGASLNAMRDAIMAGVPLEVVRHDPQLMRAYASHIKLAHEYRLDYERGLNEKDRAVACWYVWGGTRLGKTHAALEYWRKERGRRDVYRITDWQAPFDGYHGQTVLICDEFSGQLPCETMNSLMEGYSGAEAHARYQNVVPAWDTVIVISNIDLNDQYRDVPAGPRSAFRARFEGHVRHVTQSWRDPGYENPWPQWVSGQAAAQKTADTASPSTVELTGDATAPNVCLTVTRPGDLSRFIASARFNELPSSYRERLADIYEYMHAAGLGR